MILRRTLTFITVLCTVIALCGIVAAEEPTIPVIPQAFYGDVQIGGAPAPVGTTIEIRGAGVQTGTGNPFTVTVVGKYGKTGVTGPSLFAQGNITEGTPITFWVNGVQAQIVTATGVQESVLFTSGADKTQVNLQAAAGGAEPTAIATTSPSASNGGGGGTSYHYSGGGGGGGGGSYSGFFDAPGSASGNTNATVTPTKTTTSSPSAQKNSPASVTTVQTTITGAASEVATSPPLGVSPILIGAIVIVIIAAVASGGYYMIQKGKKEGSKVEKEEEKKEL